VLAWVVVILGSLRRRLVVPLYQVLRAASRFESKTFGEFRAAALLEGRPPQGRQPSIAVNA
jgi:nitrate/nitrite-specific signal transduction histidine kinase